MCGSCKAVVVNKLERDSVERTLKVQFLKERWAKEKELKAQIFKEKKEAELRKVKLLCQQALREQNIHYDRLKSEKNNHGVVPLINRRRIAIYDDSLEQHDVYSENSDQHYLQSASYLGSTSNEQFFPFIVVDQNIQSFNSASSDQNKPWLQPFNDRITLKSSMVV